MGIKERKRGEVVGSGTRSPRFLMWIRIDTRSIVFDGYRSKCIFRFIRFIDKNTIVTYRCSISSFFLFRRNVRGIV